MASFIGEPKLVCWYVLNLDFPPRRAVSMLSYYRAYSVLNDVEQFKILLVIHGNFN